MTWTILVYIDTSGNHFKFWSFSDDNRVAWGRIGTNGTIREFPQHVISSRYHDKLSEGYRELGRGFNRHFPNSEEARQFWYGESVDGEREQRIGRVVRVREIPQIQTSEEVNEEIAEREIRQTAPAQRTRSRANEKYTTDSDGYLKKYRTGYVRVSTKKYNIYGKDSIYSNPTILSKVKTFYESIPQNMVATNKRPFGNDFESQQIFGRYSGKYRFIMDNNKIVGAFEFNSRTVTSEFFYLKTSEVNYHSLIRFMIESISGLASGSQNQSMTIKTKGAKLKNALNGMFEWESKTTTSNGVTTWKIKPSNILSTQSISKRFQEMNW